MDAQIFSAALQGVVEGLGCLQLLVPAERLTVSLTAPLPFSDLCCLARLAGSASFCILCTAGYMHWHLTGHVSFWAICQRICHLDEAFCAQTFRSRSLAQQHDT